MVAGSVVIESQGCNKCGFELWLPIAQLRVSTLGLYDDARFPGRCLLRLQEHVEDLQEVPQEMLSDFMSDALDAARAIKAVSSADRINYAILGNTVPHVHFHLIPRKSNDEPIPRESPWDDPRPLRKLPLDQQIFIRSELAMQLLNAHELLGAH